MGQGSNALATDAHLGNIDLAKESGCLEQLPIELIKATEAYLQNERAATS